MYEMWGGGGAPFNWCGHKGKPGSALGRDNTEVYLLGESLSLLSRLHYHPDSLSGGSGKFVVAAASTCDEPSWARALLKEFELSPSYYLQSGESKKEGHTPVFAAEEAPLPHKGAPVKMGALFAGFDDIYNHCRKPTHMANILKKAKEQLGDDSITFKDFIFFDNQTDNIRDCAKIGVCGVYCPNGMTGGVWEKGLEQWRAAQKS